MFQNGGGHKVVGSVHVETVGLECNERAIGENECERGQLLDLLSCHAVENDAIEVANSLSRSFADIHELGPSCWLVRVAIEDEHESESEEVAEVVERGTHPFHPLMEEHRIVGIVGREHWTVEGIEPLTVAAVCLRRSCWRMKPTRMSRTVGVQTSSAMERFDQVERQASLYCVEPNGVRICLVAYLPIKNSTTSKSPPSWRSAAGMRSA